MSEGGSYSQMIKSKLNAKTIAIFVFGILLLAVGIYFVYKFIAPKLKTSYSVNKSKQHTDSSGDKTAELLLFFAEWCPHCKHAAPEWEAAKEKYDGHTINGYTVIFTDINCTKETPESRELMEKYKVQGFPTVKLLKDDQVVDFNAKVTTDNINQFLTTVL
ncbi:MAG: hypothetical protein EBS86_13585 [Crocinitomicaceae bacterium]|nr:hypothetical protein [Crocinitomicaceae bacterium]